MNLENEKAWAKSMALAMKVYQASRAFPKEACGGTARLCQQAAVAIPVHLAGPSAGRGRARALACLRVLERELKRASDQGCLTPSELAALAWDAAEVTFLLKFP